MPEKIGDKEFLTAAEAAEYLKVSTPQIYNFKSEMPDFPFHQIGGKLLFEKSELAEWVMAH